MNLQMSYDIKRARDDIADVLARIEPFHDAS
jgi:hypothetical protein